MRRFAATVAALTQVAIGGMGCGESAPEEARQLALGPADPTDTRAVVAGEAIYLAHCAACHGARLEGQANWQEVLPDGGYPAPPHDGSGHTWRHSDRQLFEATKSGGDFSAAPGSVSHMPGFANVLSDAEIWAALAFVKSRWPAELRARQWLLTRIRSQRPRVDQEGHAGH
jgi:mono/diheme cytochrome c family protein